MKIEQAQLLATCQQIILRQTGDFCYQKEVESDSHWQNRLMNQLYEISESPMLPFKRDEIICLYEALKDVHKNKSGLA